MTQDLRSESTDEPINSGSWWCLFGALAIIVVLALVISGFLIDSLAGEQGRGSVGDMFGLANAFFSGLAFAGLIVTMLMQRKDLQLQQEEIRRNRIEFKKTARAQEEMVKLAKQENDDRRARERRAATLFLTPWKVAPNTPIKEYDGRLYRTFTTTSRAKIATGLNVSAFESTREINIEPSEWLVLYEDELLSITVSTSKVQNSGTRLEFPGFSFLLNYIDANGRQRQHKYEAALNSEEIQCINLGFEGEDDPFGLPESLDHSS